RVRSSPVSGRCHIRRCGLTLLRRKSAHLLISIETRGRLCSLHLMSRDLIGFWCSLQDSQRKNKEHHRREKTEYRRDTGRVFRVSDTKKRRHHHHKENEPENAEDHSVLYCEE